MTIVGPNTSCARPLALAITLAVVALAVAAGCNGDPVGSSPGNDASNRDTAVLDRGQGEQDARVSGDAGTARDVGARADGALDLTVVGTGATFVDSCKAFTSNCAGSKDANCGKCEYRIRYRAACSKAQPCDDLVLLFTASNCRSNNVTKQIDRVTAAYPRVVVACVAPQITAQMLPVSLGAPERERALFKTVFERARHKSALGVWTGKNLLLTGCSAGGSRYPVLAARYADDASWLGQAKTAACFGDGVVSIGAQDAFVGEKLGVGASCESRHRRIASAYTGAPTSGHACSNSPQQQCACDPGHAFRRWPNACGGGDCVSFDSIVVRRGSGFALAAGVTPASFAIRHWKLISDGSSWADSSERCENDVAPKGPYQALCSAIDAAPTHHCTFVERPADKHCAAYWRDYNSACIQWFRSL